jgi:hypothetical protein
MHLILEELKAANKTFLLHFGTFKINSSPFGDNLENVKQFLTGFF